jgi:SAM-dependent methyltransferase
VLELGCGQGRDTWLFANSGLKVVALDYSETGICQMEEDARQAKLDGLISPKVHDVRLGIPLPDGSVDAVYSHMFFCMELKEKEAALILQECLRVLRPGGLNVYSVRNEHDPHYRKFVHKGEDMYQNPRGFVVQFYDREKVERLAKGYEIVSVREFEESSTASPKVLYEVVLRKPA